MIYTVTFNPSLDYIVSVDRFELGRTNRTTEECMLPGGKGINVSTVLHALGVESTALGFTAGFTGEELEKRVRKLGIQSEFIHLPEGETRINVKLKDYDGTEINGMGPRVDEQSLRSLMKRLHELKDGDTLVLSGSIPKESPETVYRDILASVRRPFSEGDMYAKDIRCVVDAGGRLLKDVLPYEPFLIKPNHHELGELFGVELTTRDSVIPYATELQKMGARNVLVSMAGEGAVLLDETGEVHMHEAPKGILVNAVGAGDSMVAGFLAGCEDEDHRNKDDNSPVHGKTCPDYEYAFRMGLAAGSASAFSERLATREEILQVLRTMIGT